MTPTAIREYIAAFGGRRFLLVVGAGLIDSILFFLGILSESGYTTLTLATVGAYISANVVQKVKNKEGPTA